MSWNTADFFLGLIQRLGSWVTEGVSVLQDSGHLLSNRFLEFPLESIPRHWSCSLHSHRVLSALNLCCCVPFTSRSIQPGALYLAELPKAFLFRVCGGKCGGQRGKREMVWEGSRARDMIILLVEGEEKDSQLLAAGTGETLGRVVGTAAVSPQRLLPLTPSGPDWGTSTLH